ncbi:MAG TPA: hypothetical protein VN222_16015 [Novosphingobium sp.]|nr:hypothetical protein [Novosphingobium sp.]
MPDALSPDVARQVRIDQRLSIRISPGSAVLPPGVIIELEQEERPSRVEQRKIAKCLPVNMIAGVQSGRGNQLILFLRDNHVVAAALDKSCRAQDFYSGFYLEKNADGQVCVGRDKLQSRSGANCAIRSWRGLVDAVPRRFP